MSLESMARVHLAHLPTPLDDAPRLSALLGGPRILVKRDDMTGLAFGGNKTRKLEYLMGDAMRQGADTIFTSGAPQSNHCRQTAAAAARLGLRCILVLTPGEHNVMQGNLLLDRLLKAEIVYTESEDENAVMADLAAAENAKGHKSYVIPVGGSNGVGTLGYASLVLEMAGQFFERGLSASRVYVSSGSGGTQGGLLLGKRLYHAGWQLIGCSSGRTAGIVRPKVVRTANEGARVLGMAEDFTEADVTVDDRFIGPGYGIPTAESQEAIRLFAESEGILLDPVYTAKAAAAMIHDIRSGVLSEAETIMFIHTGGTPAIFAYHAEVAEGIAIHQTI